MEKNLENIKAIVKAMMNYDLEGHRNETNDERKIFYSAHWLALKNVLDLLEADEKFLDRERNFWINENGETVKKQLEGICDIYTK